MMFRFNLKYFLWTVALFLTEVAIALYIHDAFIRPYFGDFLVVVLIFCFVRSFFKTRLVPTLIGVLLFAYLIETAQYFHIVNALGLQGNRLAETVIGTGFSWVDMLMYTLGGMFLKVINVNDKNHLPA
ncbi:ribosomal maturation YjgA family protein [Mucilaginibacter ginkgonis]|uniref:DUF2809 domain-containing protein n=1 Tax=Mucilaginibacter ginkgonis TaxID=2682091 RepID=A0A6I4HYC8_9SPHI|nr:DUF2809 domain-containing protein [Mucilaginibacter ginkgonis]QQL49593.1 DUF2809 domain-containing protein [Mucilaginibacter ginkgonis]